jgi:hypothetical protein
VELVSVGIALNTFKDSRWFTPGWTLQELIAPDQVVFFDTSWKEIGSRIDLLALVCSVTGIDAQFFSRRVLANYSIAKRMSWASQRCTTHI